MLSIKDLVKVYNTKGGLSVVALDKVSIDFPERGMVFLLGRSGSGKSTLLNVVGGLDTPTSGEIIVKGKSSAEFTASDFDSYRNTYIGFVFQDYNLLNEFTVEENIAIALRLQNRPNDKEAVDRILKLVELDGYAKRKPNTLSGGQKQRVAIARAIIKDPEIVMADEPTGALDSNTGKQIFDTLKKLSKSRLVIVVSHDRSFAEEYGDRIIELQDGIVISDKTKSTSSVDIESTNVTIVSDDTITVKDWKKVTDEDIKEIVSIMRQTGGETVISSSKKEIPQIKKILSISENDKKTCFKKTEKVERKQYDGSEAKFIKSRLPFSHAFKMAATNFKFKPFRLLFTIFLSVVAFTLFGVLSTLMLYDSAYSVSKAMIGSQYQSVAITKQYDAVYENIQIKVNGEKNVATTFDTKIQAGYSNIDIENMNSNGLGLNFMGVTDLGYYEYTGLSTGEYISNEHTLKNLIVGSTYLNYFGVKKLCGFSDCGEDYLKANGFEPLANYNKDTGVYAHYPEKPNEIAISNYVFELYKHSQANNNASPWDYNTYNDIIGRAIYVGSMTLVVTQVYDVGEIPEKFNELYNKNTTFDNFAIRDLKDEMKDLIEYSYFTVGFVSGDFYEAHRYDNITIGQDVLYKTQMFRQDKAPEKGSANKIPEGYSTAVYTPRSTELYNYSIKFLDLKGQSATADIPDNQVYVSVDSVIADNDEKFMKAIQNLPEKDQVQYRAVLSALKKYQAEDDSMAASEFLTIYNAMVKDYKKLVGEEMSFKKIFYLNRLGKTGELKIAGVFVAPNVIVNSYRKLNYYMSNNTADSITLPPPKSSASIAKEVANYKSSYKVDAQNDKYNIIMTLTDNEQEQTMFMLTNNEKGTSTAMLNKIYELSNSIAELFNQLETAFLVAGLVVGVFAALMLLNFISVGIENKKNEIGILRAVGARGLDVFKIFIIEALLITTVCFILSSFTSAIVCMLINRFAVESIIQINFLNFRFVNVMFILLVSLIIGILGTIFPVVKAAKRSPVESIRAL